MISSADPNHFIKTGTVQLDSMTGDTFDLLPLRGGNGIAFRTAKDFWGNGSGRVVLLSGSFVLPPSTTTNPVPKSSSLSPSNAAAPGPNTWVTITGSDFVRGSVALWNGTQRTTVFIDSGHLRVAVAAADLKTPGTSAKIVVSNPSPGGGKSKALTFTVN